MMVLSRAKYAVPLGVAIFSSAVVLAKEEIADPTSKHKRTPWDVYCDPPAKQCEKKEGSGGSSALEKCVQQCREDAIAPIKNDVAGVMAQAQGYFKYVSAVVTDNVKYLQTSASDEVRGIAIGSAGLLGILIGFRRSFFKKLVYATVLGSGTAGIIYPKEAKVLAKEGYHYTRSFSKSTFDYLKDSGSEEKQKRS